MSLLMERSASITDADNMGWSPLLWAISHNEESALLFVSRLPVESFNDKKKTTPLINACHKGTASIVHALIARGVDVNHMDSQGMDALRFAAQEGFGEITELLIGAGANLNAVSTGGVGPALLLAALNNHVQVARVLLARGADIHMHDYAGNTAALICARNGNTEFLHALFESNPFQNQVNIYGRSMVHNAAQGNHADTMSWLIAQGALLKENHFHDPADNHGVTARMLAAANAAEGHAGAATIVRMLADVELFQAEAVKPVESLCAFLLSTDGFAHPKSWLPMVQDNEQLFTWVEGYIVDQRACYASMGVDNDSLIARMCWADTVRELLLEYCVITKRNTRALIKAIYEALRS